MNKEVSDLIVELKSKLKENGVKITPYNKYFKKIVRESQKQYGLIFEGKGIYKNTEYLPVPQGDMKEDKRIGISYIEDRDLLEFTASLTYQFDTINFIFDDVFDKKDNYLNYFENNFYLLLKNISKSGVMFLGVKHTPEVLCIIKEMSPEMNVYVNYDSKQEYSTLVVSYKEMVWNLDSSNLPSLEEYIQTYSPTRVLNITKNNSEIEKINKVLSKGALHIYWGDDILLERIYLDSDLFYIENSLFEAKKNWVSIDSCRGGVFEKVCSNLYNNRGVLLVDDLFLNAEMLSYIDSHKEQILSVYIDNNIFHSEEVLERGGCFI